MATTLVTPEPTTKVADNPTKPWKAAVPIVLAALYALVEAVRIAYSDAVWDTNDTIAVVLAVITAVAVYLVPNPKVNADLANGLENGR